MTREKDNAILALRISFMEGMVGAFGKIYLKVILKNGLKALRRKNCLLLMK